MPTMNSRALPILAVAVALALTGCAVYRSTSGGGPPVVAASTPIPSATPPPNCVNPPTDITTLIEQTDPLPCYGNADLAVDALVTGGAFDCPGGLEPAWLGCSGYVLLNPLPATSGNPEFLLVARATGPSMTAVLRPDIEPLRSHAMGTVVHLTGHYDDPAAQSCRYTSWPDANPPSADEVIHTCRSTFVITAMELLKP
jgi:hypothetical protein